MMYQSRTPPEEPPCEDCRVDPLPDNQDACRIFNITRHQLIVGMSGVIDINHIPIHQAIDRYKIKEDIKCFEKVLFLGSWWVNRLNKKAE